MAEARKYDVAAQLVELIDAGAYKPGALMPTERDVAVMFGVSRGTAHEAFKILVSQGHVVGVHGRGHFVRDQPALVDAVATYLALLDEAPYVDNGERAEHRHQLVLATNAMRIALAEEQERRR